MLASITVYFNTGFNGTDIPADASVLSNAQNKTYPDYYYIREDIDKPIIRIKDTYENLCDVDYVKIESGTRTSYFFAVPSSISQGVTALSLDLDALLTIGGAKNVQYSSGWQERGHIAKADDVLFENISSEPWTPSTPLEAVNLKAIESTKEYTPGEDDPETPEDYEIISSNIKMIAPGQGSALGDGTLTQEVIEGIVAGDTDPVMYFPAIQTPSEEDSTDFILYDGTQTDAPTPSVIYRRFKITGMSAYNAKNANVQNAVSKLFSAGQLQLQASYKIPWEYIDESGGRTSEPVAGWFSRICGYHQETTENTLPFVYEGDDHYVVKNKKCLETYRKYIIVNLASGDMSIKSPHEIYDGESTAPKILVWADPTSTGKPYARFSYIKDNPLQWADCVKGLQWSNNMLCMEGASGSLWNSINAAFANQTLQRQQTEADLNNRYASMKQGNAMAMSSLDYATQTLMFDEQKKQIGTNYGQSLGSSLGQALGALFGAGSAGSGAAGAAVMGAGAIGAGAQLMNSLDQLNIQQAQAQQARAIQVDQEQLDFKQLGEQKSLQDAKIKQSVNENQIGLYKNNSVVAPTIMFTPEQNLGLYGYNKFAVYEIRKSDADLKSEDMFYQRFGYSGLHRPLTAQCFNERQYYSYVQAFNVNIKSPFGMRIRQKAIAQLNAGVRVWKVLPDASYYELN